MMKTQEVSYEAIQVHRQPDHCHPKQHENGVPVAELAREHGVSTALIYQWRSKYGGMDAALMKRLKELEAENGRLKKNVRRRTFEGRDPSGNH